MTDANKEKIRERRRAQNRKAQRRFRENQSRKLEDVYDVFCLDVQSLEPYNSNNCPSQALLSSPYANTTPQNLDTSTFPTTDGLLLDNFGILDFNSNVAANQNDIDPSSFHTFPASLASRERPHSSHSRHSSMSFASQPLVPSNHAGSTDQEANHQSAYESSTYPHSHPRTTSTADSVGDWLNPLHIAARKGRDRIVHILLQQSIDANEEDSDGLSPLAHAVIGGHEDVVHSLLLHGACIGDDGVRSSTNQLQRPSALHWAVQYRREAVLRMLLNHCMKNRAVIDSYDEGGRTPLHTAIDMDFEEGVVLLLQFGADPKKKTRKI